jgi:hypothetical protein
MTSGSSDMVTSNLDAPQFYKLDIPATALLDGSFNEYAAVGRESRSTGKAFATLREVFERYNNFDRYSLTKQPLKNSQVI